MRLIITGETEDTSGETQVQLANEVYNSDVLQLLISQLAKLDFEVRTT